MNHTMHLWYFFSCLLTSLLVTNAAVDSSSSLGNCSPLTVTTIKSRSTIDVQTKAIELIAQMKMEFNPSSYYMVTSYFALSFDHPLKVYIDYEIDYLKPENVMPDRFKQTKAINATVFAIILKPGKVWIKDLLNQAKTLNLIGASVCKSYEASKSHVPKLSSKPLRIATFVTQKQHHCPKIPLLPGATPELNSYLNNTLHTCTNLRIFKSHKLVNHHINSFGLLLPNIEAVFIDASDQHNITEAAKIVDTFLASHSVLDLVWEPYSDDEPKWFVLIPRPRGMPGHLFAMMDTVQWHHPSVTSHRGVIESQCTQSNHDSSCVMGCPDTFLHRMTGSGWGADSWHTMIDARRAMMYDKPVQAAPLTYEHNKPRGPVWSGQSGWTYTYEGCDSNFLDCYFLDHSPCPKVSIDPYNILPDGNRTRVMAWNMPRIGDMDGKYGRQTDAWWHDVFLPYRPDNIDESSDAFIPAHSISGKHDIPGEQVFGSLFWRPKYELRKETQKRVNNFNLQDACAAMHVRRSDVIHHGIMSRAYVRVESYVRAARPVMDALGIKTIVLFTDSMSAIEEAMNCTKEYPDVCEGIKFRYIDKKRWYGAEGGWENHMPSGSPKQELQVIEMELTLATKCSMIIMGSSSFSDKLKAQMCCGFPLHERGHLPKRCICPPHIQAHPRGFGSCEEGNLLLCKNITIDAKTFTENYKIAKTAQTFKLISNNLKLQFEIDDAKPAEVKEMYTKYIDSVIKENCKRYDHGPKLGAYCSRYTNQALWHNNTNFFVSL